MKPGQKANRTVTGRIRKTTGTASRTLSLSYFFADRSHS